MKHLFIIILFASCATQNRCERKYPPAKIDSTYVKHDTIITYDTTFIPYEEVTIDTNGIIPPSVTYHREAKKGRVKSTVDIKNGKLTVTCLADSLMIVNEQLNEIIRLSNFKREIIYKDCLKDHRTKYDYFARWWSYISLSLLAIIGIGYWIIRAFKG